MGGCPFSRELESQTVDRTLDSELRACGFKADSQVIEVTGRCLRCREEA